MKTVPAGEFKAKCLRLMDEVSQTGEPLLITKRGKPVVEMHAASEGDNRLLRQRELEEARRKLRGTITYHGDIVAPLEDYWEDVEQRSPDDPFGLDIEPEE